MRHAVFCAARVLLFSGSQIRSIQSSCFLRDPTAMGVGSSTSGRSDSTVTVLPRRSQSNGDNRDHHSHHHHRSNNNMSDDARSLQDHHRPTDSCCCHHQENHAAAAALTRTVTPASRRDVSPVTTDDNIDDEIEEIVANTLDIVSRHQSAVGSAAGGQQRVYDTGYRNDSVESAGRPHLRTVSVSSRAERTSFRRNSASDVEQHEDSDAKESLPEVDFAKFKKVNHKGATLQRNGKVIHHQESDLLWRLGLISPEAYTITKTTRSAPHSQGQYLKTPSYDLTEEQLMANIEKEFTGCAGAI